MPAGRPNTIDESPKRIEIIRDMLRGRKGPAISRDYGISLAAVERYRQKDLRKYIAGGDPVFEYERKLAEVDKNKAIQATRDLVMEDVSGVRAGTWKMVNGMLASIPEDGKIDCDVKAAAGLFREIRQNAELQARLEGRLQDRSTTQVNVVILSSHSSTAPEPQPQPETPAAPGDQVLDAEWSEIAPGD